MVQQQVYAAIAQVAAELARGGIAKTQSNLEDGYQFRSIDAVYNHLGPLLAKHKLCFLPRMLERECSVATSSTGEILTSVTLKAAFDLISAKDGSCHTIQTFGEALDTSDKATNKAMSAAYKYAAIQAFCIPTGEDNDADRRTLVPRPSRSPTRSSSQTPALPALQSPTLPPPEGWERWVEDLGSVANSCETEEALSRLQQTYRPELRALAASYRPLYTSLGAVIHKRRTAIKAGRSGAAGRSDTGVDAGEKFGSGRARQHAVPEIEEAARAAA